MPLLAHKRFERRNSAKLLIPVVMVHGYLAEVIRNCLSVELAKTDCYVSV